ncbi:hypothetical protein IWX46DRAFT_30788 [Phyllosticta citricarpa]|uniref:Uncharacterized protein n=1 Tax=Phyllosticta citricarpa TaxID=55181 RepID=A0ABR1MRI4_9PEZI
MASLEWQRARSTTLDELGHGPMMSGNLIFPAPSAYRSIFRHADGTYDWQTELSDGFSLVDRASCGSLAALIVEPILSSGGMTELPDGWVRPRMRRPWRRGWPGRACGLSCRLWRALGVCFGWRRH